MFMNHNGNNCVSRSLTLKIGSLRPRFFTTLPKTSAERSTNRKTLKRTLQRIVRCQVGHLVSSNQNRNTRHSWHTLQFGVDAPLHHSSFCLLLCKNVIRFELHFQHLQCFLLVFLLFSLLQTHLMSQNSWMNYGAIELVSAVRALRNVRKTFYAFYRNTLWETRLKFCLWPCVSFQVYHRGQAQEKLLFLSPQVNASTIHNKPAWSSSRFSGSWTGKNTLARVVTLD